MCLNISNLYPIRFISDSGLAWEAVLKKTEVKLQLLTDINMLLMIGKGNRSKIRYAIHTYEESFLKYMKGHNKKIESPCLQYWDVNNSYRWVKSQKLLGNSLEWIELLNLMKT